MKIALITYEKIYKRLLSESKEIILKIHIQFKVPVFETQFAREFYIKHTLNTSPFESLEKFNIIFNSYFDRKKSKAQAIDANCSLLRTLQFCFDFSLNYDSTRKVGVHFFMFSFNGRQSVGL